MTIRIQRETLLKPLQAVIGVVEKRQTLPILSNVLLSVKDGHLSLTGTDLEVELQSRAQLEGAALAPLSITVPGRKFVDIVRSLPEDSNIELITEKDRLLIKSGRSRFSLSILPADDFPTIRDENSTVQFTLDQKDLHFLTQRTHFAMAQQDVRYYLNGMLLEVNDGLVRTVATDGHRLALNTIPAPVIDNSFIQVILPRKGVMELMRLLNNIQGDVTVNVSNNFARITGPDFVFTSKLIDGRFPDYEKVLPKNGDKTIVLDREVFKQALTRTSILSNEKFRGVRLQLRQGLLRIVANNPDQEEAEEEISLDYDADNMEMGFNVTYLLDILNTINANTIKLTFSDPNSSILIEEHAIENGGLFVVMPMRL